jgi:hypothetical protein
MTAESPAFVVSLVASDCERQDEVVLGVRRRCAQAPRHPGVVSTPTQRVPRAVFAACCRSWPLPSERLPVIVDIDEIDSYPVGEPRTSEHAVSYVVESLLSRKLEMATPLAGGLVRGTARPVAVASAVVLDRQGHGSPEHTVMLTVRVVASGLAAHLPASTAFYRHLLLCDTARLATAVRHNDALIVDDTLDPFEVCIGGLCVTSAAAVLEPPDTLVDYADGRPSR